MLLLLGAKAEFVHQLQGVAQRVATLELVFDLPEDLPDLVLDRVRPARTVLEALEVRGKVVVDELDQIVADQGVIVIEGSVGLLRGRPVRPAMQRRS